MKFRVLYGQHIHGRDSAGKPRVYGVGDIVESTTDLASRFNSEGSQKFERIYREMEESKDSPTPNKGYTPERLESLPLRDLLALATQEGVEIKSQKRDEVIKTLKEALLG